MIYGKIIDAQLLDPMIAGECNNEKCNEDVYYQDGLCFNSMAFCNTTCIGEFLLQEKEAHELKEEY